MARNIASLQWETQHHYANMSVQYTANFNGCKSDNFQFKCLDFFLIFCSKHRLWVHVRTAPMRPVAVRTSTHDLCFRAKIRKKMYTPVNPSFFYIKVGCKGVFISRTCFHDVTIGSEMAHW